MEFRTTFKTEPSPCRIAYKDKVLFIGSCFASSIGSYLDCGKMDVLVNPSGAVFNPVSVSNTLETISSGKEFTESDLYFYDGKWLSFFHYTDFSSADPKKVLDKINKRSGEAHEFLKGAKFLFVTFGTARIYRLKTTGMIVSNCHKMPSALFSSELLSVDDITTMWANKLDRLHTLFPQLKIVFTISPIRHWKDGAHGNQVSKSVLFLAVEELLGHPSNPQYFPAYELLMDDLRDYRYYDDDMIHPSSAAIKYIWDVFSGCYFDINTINTWNEVEKITRASKHRFNTDSDAKTAVFANRMLKQISELEIKVPSIDLSFERSYFFSLLKE